MKMKKEKSCGIVVFREVNHEVEYLLLKSKNHGNWGFPKGHMEGKETERETANREVLEESGLEVPIMEGLRVVTEYLIEDNISKTVVYFVGKVENQEVYMQASEVSNYAWTNYEETLNRLAYDDLKAVIFKVNQFLVENS